MRTLRTCIAALAFVAAVTSAAAKVQAAHPETVAIAHPFLSIAPLTAGLGHAGLASITNVERLEQEYDRPFESIASPAETRGALALAAPLSFLDMAVRYRAQAPSVVRLHPWMRDLVPQTIRLALARLRDRKLDDFIPRGISGSHCGF